jgi:hypothetical protein
MNVPVAARLDRLPPTRTHRHATIVAGIGSFFDLFDIFLAGVLGTVLMQQFQLDRFVYRGQQRVLERPAYFSGRDISHLD